jgi:DNA primase
MLPITAEELLELLVSPKKGASNHYIATCPCCNKPEHFYVNIKTGAWDCKKCQEAGNIYKLLFILGKDIEIVKKTVDFFTKLIPVTDDLQDEEPVDLTTQIKPLPIGFKRLTDHPYLKDRHVLPEDYNRFRIGVTKLKQIYKDYILFSIDEGGQSRGFVGRTTHTKEYVVANDVKRYRNSKATKFGNLLFGYDLITPNTTTVIVVEGLFDVIRINNFLNVYQNEDLRCVASFGKKISKTQILKLLAKGNVQKVILIYDVDAVNQTKKYAMQLEQFFEVQIGFFANGKDASASTDQEVFEVLSSLQKSTAFFYSKLPVYKFTA